MYPGAACDVGITTRTLARRGRRIVNVADEPAPRTTCFTVEGPVAERRCTSTYFLENERSPLTLTENVPLVDVRLWRLRTIRGRTLTSTLRLIAVVHCAS